MGDVHRESGRYEGDGNDYSTSKMGSKKSAPPPSKAKDAPKEQAKTANEKGWNHMSVGAETPMGLDVASPVSHSDYFSDEEYWAVTGQTQAGDDRDQPPEIAIAQAEVIERLERWAGMAWQRRTYVEQVGAEFSHFLLARRPVISIESLTLDAVAFTDYLYTSSGLVSWGDPLYAHIPLPYPTLAVASYTYGYDAVPWSIKRPAIRATQALIRTGTDNEFPENVESYTHHGTTVRFMQVTQNYIDKPWPWDPTSSEQVRAWVGQRKRFLSSV